MPALFSPGGHAGKIPPCNTPTPPRANPGVTAGAKKRVWPQSAFQYLIAVNHTSPKRWRRGNIVGYGST